MPMYQYIVRRWLQVLVGVMITCGFGAIVACWWFQIWSFEDALAYEGMRRECHPVWKELQAGSIRQGQSVDALPRQSLPTFSRRFGRYSMLYFDKNPTADGLPFTNLVIIAEDDRLVAAKAGSCTWEKTFFDGWSTSQWAAFNAAWKADVDDAYKKRQDIDRSKSDPLPTE